MPVRLERVPAPAVRPEPPRLWRWLVLLPPCLALGLGGTLWLGGESLGQHPVRFWLLALGLPFLVWCVLAGLRLMAYLAADAAADGWDRAREAELSQMMRRGRRSQQVLATSLRTALDAGDDAGERQRAALLKEVGALRAQSSWQGKSVRHSRLVVDEALPLEQQLRGQLLAVLEDLAAVLERLPQDRPLALLLEAGSSIEQELLWEAWTQAWELSGIRQKTARLQGSGLSVVDHWLDRRIDDQALLLVVACQFAPESVEGTAEVVVGVLFGNRLTQSTVAPMAYLHRPEPVGTAAAEPLSEAFLQALDWVPVSTSAISHVWKAGSDAAGNQLITQALDKACLPVSASAGLHDLDAALGHAGCATPWLAIAASVGVIRAGGGAQLICSGDGAQGIWSWCSVVMPPEV